MTDKKTPIIDGTGDVIVLGVGKSGRAVADLVTRLGGTASITDDSVDPSALPADFPQNCQALSVDDAVALLSKRKKPAGVVTSPGVPSDHAVLAAAVAKKVPVLSEPAFAAQYLECDLVGITGTNGKSTTVSLLGDMLMADGRKPFVGGNLGRPLCDAIGGDYDIAVVELSSFQLEWPGDLKPKVGAVLNISPDHLDRHGDMQTYIDTKMRLFENMGPDDTAVFSHDQEWWRPAAESIDAKIAEFAVSRQAHTHAAMRFDPQDRALRGPQGWHTSIGVDWPNSPFDYENLAAAALMAHALGVSSTAVRRGTDAFKPLGHRLRRVAVIDGVEYWNDSKATNIGAALASLEAFTEPVILLTGGVAKGAQFEALTDAPGVKLFVAYGEAREEIAASVGGGRAVEQRSDMGSAFETAVENARPGDVVLLAPACASFDEFSDYAARGRAFEERVVGLRDRPPRDR